MLALMYLSMRVQALEQRLSATTPLRSSSTGFTAPVIPRADLSDLELPEHVE